MRAARLAGCCTRGPTCPYSHDAKTRSSCEAVHTCRLPAWWRCRCHWDARSRTCECCLHSLQDCKIGDFGATAHELEWPGSLQVALTARGADKQEKDSELLKRLGVKRIRSRTATLPYPAATVLGAACGTGFWAKRLQSIHMLLVSLHGSRIRKKTVQFASQAQLKAEQELA